MTRNTMSSAVTKYDAISQMLPAKCTTSIWYYVLIILIYNVMC